jgi:hypothetical protein
MCRPQPELVIPENRPRAVFLPSILIFLFSENNREKNRGNFAGALRIAKFCPKSEGSVARAGKEQAKNRKTR